MYYRAAAALTLVPCFTMAIGVGNFLWSKEIPTAKAMTETLAGQRPAEVATSVQSFAPGASNPPSNPRGLDAYVSPKP